MSDAMLPTPASVAESLRSQLPQQLQIPAIFIVCGSGLAGLADLLEDRVDIPYTEIQGFQASTGVEGVHADVLKLKKTSLY
jgi:purine-nucleoside phosphorylase